MVEKGSRGDEVEDVNFVAAETLNSGGTSKTIEENEQIELIIESTADDSRTEDIVIDYTAGALWPFISKLGFGGICGFCAGYAIKQASKVAAMLFGLTFIGLQGLQYAGYIEVKWQKIKEDGIRLIDSDGSGKVGVKDIKFYLKRVFAVLRYHGPTASGLGAGLYYGFHKG